MTRKDRGGESVEICGKIVVSSEDRGIKRKSKAVMRRKKDHGKVMDDIGDNCRRCDVRCDQPPLLK